MYPSGKEDSTNAQCSADEPMTTFCECQSCGKSVLQPCTMESTPANSIIPDGGNSAERWHDDDLNAAFSSSTLAFGSDGIPGVEMTCVRTSGSEPFSADNSLNKFASGMITFSFATRLFLCPDLAHFWTLSSLSPISFGL